MNFFTDTFEELPDWKRLTEALRTRETPVCVTGLSLIHKAQLALTASKNSTEPFLLLTGSEAEAMKLCADMNAMAGETVALHYPAKEMLFTSAESKSKEYEHERLHVLNAVTQNQIKIIVSGTEAVLQPTIPPETLKNAYQILHHEDTIILNDFIQKMIHTGYIRCETVEGKGQFAVRGAIIDIYPVQMLQPVRIELWGDEIDSISYFDTETQRRTEKLDSVIISPASELLYNPQELKEKILTLSSKVRGKYKDLIQANFQHDIDRLEAGLELINTDKYYSLIYEKNYYLTDYVSGLVILCEYADIHRHAQALSAQHREDLQMLYEQGILYRNLPDGILAFSEFQAQIAERNCIYLSQFLQGSERIAFRKIISMQTMQNAPWGGEIRQLLEDLQEYISHNYRVVLAVGSEKTLPILVNDLQESGIRCSIAQEQDTCPEGFVLVTAKSISG
ncbi:MAG: transcription-repair coupling factor, partial [Oscillospiraceae bacterium]|nr:transcription-repair coupling factor [Oscillospiraceae bacterium]